jgi:hypothetical protein
VAYEADRAEHGVLPDLGLPAAARSAVARPPPRADGDVPDLTGEPGSAADQHAVHDDPGADTDLAPDPDEVPGPDTGAAGELGERGQIRVVGDEDGGFDVERRPERLGDGGIAPFEVGCDDDHAVPAHDTGDRDADRVKFGGGRRGEHGPAELGEVSDVFFGRPRSPRPGLPGALEDDAAESDEGGTELVGKDLDGEDHRALGFDFDDRRRTARDPGRARWALADEAALDEVADEVADRAPVEPRPLGQLRPRCRTAQMDSSQDRTEIPTADGVARGPAHGSGHSLARWVDDRASLLEIGM